MTNIIYDLKVFKPTIGMQKNLLSRISLLIRQFMINPLRIQKVFGPNKPNDWTGSKNGIKSQIMILQKPRLNGLKVEK